MYCKYILSLKPSSKCDFINILRVSDFFKKLTITPNCYMSVLEPPKFALLNSKILTLQTPLQKI